MSSHKYLISEQVKSGSKGFGKLFHRLKPSNPSQTDSTSGRVSKPPKSRTGPKSTRRDQPRVTPIIFLIFIPLITLTLALSNAFRLIIPSKEGFRSSLTPSPLKPYSHPFIRREYACRPNP